MEGLRAHQPYRQTEDQEVREVQAVHDGEEAVERNRVGQEGAQLLKDDREDVAGAERMLPVDHVRHVDGQIEVRDEREREAAAEVEEDDQPEIHAPVFDELPGTP